MNKILKQTMFTVALFHSTMSMAANQDFEVWLTPSVKYNLDNNTHTCKT
jgi:hypothetical protein